MFLTLHLPQLQLGHAGEGVEIKYTDSTQTKVAVLQLGHAGEGVEMPGRLWFGGGGVGFNWATPVKAWRSYTVPPAIDADNLRASIGPRR